MSRCQGGYASGILSLASRLRGSFDRSCWRVFIRRMQAPPLTPLYSLVPSDFQVPLGDDFDARNAMALPTIFFETGAQNPVITPALHSQIRARPSPLEVPPERELPNPYSTPVARPAELGLTSTGFRSRKARTQRYCTDELYRLRRYLVSRYSSLPPRLRHSISRTPIWLLHSARTTN